MKRTGKQISLGIRILLAVLAAVVLWQLVGHFFSAQAKSKGRSEKEIIQEIVYAYYWDQNPSSKRMQALLKELEEINQDTSKRWRGILDCWEESSTDMPVYYGSLPDHLKNGKQLCLIILGFQLNSDGSMQQELVSRLDIGLKSAEKYPDSLILCTGGGTAADAPGVTEADVMAQWLEEHGIEKERIIIENRSLTTSQNAIFSYQILTEQYPIITQAAIISSDYHLPWAVVLFQTQFTLGAHPLTVVSNAACRTEKTLSEKTLLRYQVNGILEIAGMK